jgi:glutaredoxin-like protein NrdH
MNIEVYSKPQCVQCTYSKVRLQKAGLEYSEIDIMDDPEAFKFVTETLKYRSAPIIVVRDEDGNITDSWAGFNPEKIDNLSVKV